MREKPLLQTLSPKKQMQYPSLAIYAVGPETKLKVRLVNLVQGGLPRPDKLWKITFLLIIFGITILFFGVRYFGDPPNTPSTFQEEKDFVPQKNLNAATSDDPYASTMVLTNMTCWIGEKRVCTHQTTFNIERIGVIYLQNMGLITFSLKPFSDAKPIGKVEGKEITINLPTQKMRLVSMFDVLIKAADKTHVLYAKQDLQYDYRKLIGTAPDYQHVNTLQMATSFEGKPEKTIFGITKTSTYEALYPKRPKPPLAIHYTSIQVADQIFTANLGQPQGQMWLLKGDETPTTKDIVTLKGLESLGLFQFSLLPFQNATKTAWVNGNTLQVETEVGLLQITSSEDILLTETGNLWFLFTPSTPSQKEEVQHKLAQCRKDLKSAPDFAEKVCKEGGHMHPIYFSRRAS